MKLFLRLAGLAIAVVTLALWFFGGMNRGWTKTSVMVERPDPVIPELTQRTWERRFLPGLEFLAGGLLLGGALAASAYLVRGPSAKKNG